MKQNINIIVGILAVVLMILVVVAINYDSFKIKSENNDEITGKIKLPSGFHISVFADFGRNVLKIPGLYKDPRMMEFYNGVLFASIPGKGAIIALPDNDKDGKADEFIKVIDGLKNPHGIAFLDNYMYVANEDSVIKVKINKDIKAEP